MFQLLSGTDKGKQLPSALNDPFNKSSLESIMIYSRRTYRGQIIFVGSVDFQNGNTSGTQKFESSQFVQLVQKMEQFIQQLD